jgi:protein SCO1/2
MTPMTRDFRPARRLALRLVAAGGIAVALSACKRGRESQFQATDVTGGGFGRDLALQDHHGTPRTMGDFVGKVAVLFFSFTRCEDGCPQTLAMLSHVLDDLGPDGERVQVLFVTVDPERDTADVLARHLAQFHPRFLGLRGDADATARAARSFRAHYAKVPNRAGGAYTMEHSTGIYLFDPAGDVRLVVREGTTAAALAGDIRLLLA